MTWSWEVAERDHEIQDPTSVAKVRLLGEYLRLDSSSRVLDVACGKAGPAIVLAAAFGCRIHGVELSGRLPVRCRSCGRLLYPGFVGKVKRRDRTTTWPPPKSASSSI